MSTESESCATMSVDPSPAVDLVDLSGDGGVMKRVLQGGDSSKKCPESGDEVKVLYIGRLADGDRAVFDENQNRFSPFSFKLGQGQVIKGWDLAVATMQKGERCVVTLKPEYAYGSRGSPPKIPPNATLEFEIELLSWKSMSALTDDGLVSFKVTESSSEWRTAKDRWEARLTYEARLKSTGTVFDKRDEFVYVFGETNDKSFPPYFDAAVRKMKKGESGLLTLGSSYASSMEGVPAGEDVEISIKLLDLLEVEDLLKSDYPGQVWKKIIKEGDSWNKPKDNCKATIKLNAQLDDGTVVMEYTEPTEVLIGTGDLPEALDIALKSMKKGEVAHIKAPAAFGWGNTLTAQKNIPSDKSFSLDVELVDFEKGKESWEMDKEEKLQDGLRLKDQGNAFFKDGKLRAAVSKYEQAWKYFENEPKFEGEFKTNVHKTLWLPCHLNLAACFLKLDQHQKALDSTNEALKIDSQNVKALYRRAQANFHRAEYELAQKDCKRVLELDGQNRDVRVLLQQIASKMKEQLKKESKIFKGLFEKVKLVDEKELEAIRSKKSDEPSFSDSESELGEEAMQVDNEVKPPAEAMVEDQPGN